MSGRVATGPPCPQKQTSMIGDSRHMKQRLSRYDTSAHRAQIIQMSTLGRTRYQVPIHRFAPQTVSTASVISRAQLVMSRSFTGFMIVLMALFFPAGAYAQETPAPEATATVPTAAEAPAPAPPPAQPAHDQPPAPPPAPESKPPATPKKQPQAAKTGPKKPAPEPAKPKTGPKKPNGADAKKYTYNDKTGLWENGEYAWDPATGQAKPMKSLGYSYNPETKAWDNTDWRFDDKANKYVPNTVSITPQHDGSEIKLSDDAEDFFALYTDASISNLVDSTAQSGDAWVTGNTSAGSALTGDALTVATLFNLINSTAGFQGGSEIATFSSDIHGDVFGDLYIDPAALAALQPASGVGSTNVKADINQKITNDVNLNAQSGNAHVTHNTSAGDATSGSANAVANIINMMNSAVSSGSSFMGLLNIYGSLNGDILLPPGLLDMLIASNAAGQSKGSQDTSLDVNLHDTQSIVNNINTAAASGNANVSNNTQAGNATTGDAQTNVTILNLTGRNVVAANSLLVFVNVLGEWVGVIVDAPAGSTSAALGTGVTENTHREAEYDIDTSSEIVNNVNVTAQSGDANVTGNTEAGNATTGDATASANVANIVNSNFSLSGWFGILFINVFGSWTGSFGIDTAAGNKPKAPSAKPGSGKAASSSAAPKVFRFVPAEGGNGSGGGAALASVDMSNPANAQAVAQAVQAAQDKLVKERTEKSEGKDRAVQVAGMNDAATGGGAAPQSADYTLPILGFALGGMLLGGEQLISRRHRRKLIA